MYQKILVPLDGSKQAESALPVASKLARINNAEMILLRVVEYPSEIYSRCEPDSFLDPGHPGEKLMAEKDAICKEAEDYLKRLASGIEISASKVSVEIRECPVVESILGSVAKSEIDLIVMSTIGQDHNTWMMGATTSRILREAPVPVILIRKGSWVSSPDRSHQHQASRQVEAGIYLNALS